MNKKVTALTIGVIVLLGGLLIFSFIQDREAPNVEILSPIGASYYTTSNLWFEIDHVGMGVALEDIWYNWNGINETYTGSQIIVFNEGVNTLTVWARDSAGNVGFKSITFTVDTTDPSIEIMSPFADGSYYGISQLVEILASDPTTEIDEIWYNWAGSDIKYTIPEEISFDLGYNTLQAWANDSAGHTVTDSVTFIITSGNFFTSVWNTSKMNTGSSAENQVKLPISKYAGGPYLFIVDWGDGTNDTITEADQPENLHTYPSPGVYTINITGSFIGIDFDLIGNYDGDRLKIIEIKQWGDLRLGNEGNYFTGCENLIITATDILNLSGTTNLYHMFSSCFSITTIPNMEQWDVSHITNMEGMFAYSPLFNQDLGRWDVSHVTNMYSMFALASAFKGNISTWNISRVTNLDMMLSGIALPTPIYDNLLINWSQLTLQPSVSFHAGGSKYSAGDAATARGILTSTFGWTINDGGQV